MIIGYVRFTAGTADNSETLKILTAAGCTKVFSDTAGAEAGDPLPNRAAAAEAARGGTLITHRLEHLGSSLMDCLNFIIALGRSGTRIRIIEGSIDSKEPISIFELAEVFTASNAILRGEAIGAGLLAAKKRGAQFGRKTALSSADRKAALALWEKTGDAEAVAEKYNVGVSTLYRYKQEAGN